MMPLVYAEKGQPQIIRRIGGNPEVRKHLNDGFRCGARVRHIFEKRDKKIENRRKT